MLTNTFIHIPYISEKKEEDLWTQNIRCWDDLINTEKYLRDKELLKKFATLSKEHYLKKDHEFFSQRLLSRYHWRAYDDFKDRCCFLDIETTGLSKERSELTVIGLYNGNESKIFINGKNMHDFREEIKKYSYIVTFNGALFDIPFIKAKFPDIEFNQFHADLRFLLKRIGYSGGLKKIEKEVGIERESDLSGLTGKDAVKLWYRYKRDNDEKALDTLVRYNIEDIENLKTLMDLSYTKLKKNCLLSTSF